MTFDNLTFDEFDSDFGSEDTNKVNYDNIMCCCRPELGHDETLKFVLKVDDSKVRIDDEKFKTRKGLKEQIKNMFSEKNKQYTLDEFRDIL